MATRVLSAVARDYGVELSFDDFVLAPTPGGAGQEDRRRGAMSVVVVGAGLAGLTAAAGLAGARRRDHGAGGARPGRRPHPRHRGRAGAWVDAGAAYLGDRHTELDDADRPSWGSRPCRPR